MKENKKLDVIIIGGSYAGLSAAIIRPHRSHPSGRPDGRSHADGAAGFGSADGQGAVLYRDRQGRGRTAGHRW